MFKFLFYPCGYIAIHGERYYETQIRSYMGKHSIEVREEGGYFKPLKLFGFIPVKSKCINIIYFIDKLINKY